MKPLGILGLAISFVVLLAFGLRAEEITGAKIFKADKGRLAFEHEGKKRVLSFGLGLKYFDKEGAELDLLKGSGILAPGNIVTLTTEKDDTSPEPTIRAIRLVEGTIVEAKPMAKVDLHPDPNFKGTVMDSDWPKTWFAYYGNAKVGDFAEIKGFGRARREVLEVDGDSILVAHVVDTLGTRTELRWRYTMSETTKTQLERKRESDERRAKGLEEKAKAAAKNAANKSNSKSSKSSKTSKSSSSKSKEKSNEADKAKKKEKEEEPTTEIITVGDEELECTIDRIGKSSARWICEKVPFEGYVRVRIPNGNEDLVAYGRGE